MNIFNAIFGYYDKLISPLPIGYQAAISLLLLVVLIWNIYSFIKSGNWIFLAVLILMLPGTWPAAKKIVYFIWLIIKGLLIRTQGL